MYRYIYFHIPLVAANALILLPIQKAHFENYVNPRICMCFFLL